MKYSQSLSGKGIRWKVTADVSAVMLWSLLAPVIADTMLTGSICPQGSMSSTATLNVFHVIGSMKAISRDIAED